MDSILRKPLSMSIGQGQILVGQLLCCSAAVRGRLQTGFDLGPAEPISNTHKDGEAVASSEEGAEHPGHSGLQGQPGRPILPLKVSRQPATSSWWCPGHTPDFLPLPPLAHLAPNTTVQQKSRGQREKEALWPWL